MDQSMLVKSPHVPKISGWSQFPIVVEQHLFTIADSKVSIGSQISNSLAKFFFAKSVCSSIDPMYFSEQNHIPHFSWRDPMYQYPYIYIYPYIQHTHIMFPKQIIWGQSAKAATAEKGRMCDRLARLAKAEVKFESEGGHGPGTAWNSVGGGIYIYIYMYTYTIIYIYICTQ